MEKLVAGYRKFRDEVYPLREEQFAKLERGQDPRVLFITCADSRIVPELLFQAEPGELFICRNAGNIVPAHGDHNGGEPWLRRPTRHTDFSSAANGSMVTTDPFRSSTRQPKRCLQRARSRVMPMSTRHIQRPRQPSKSGARPPRVSAS